MVWSPKEKIIDTRFIGQNILQYISDNQEAALLWANGVSSWKSPARVATQEPIDIDEPGATIDGVTMIAGDRILVKAQDGDDRVQNGLYQWNGADVPMTRTSDADEAEELELVAVFVEEGTSANRWFIQTKTDVVLETTKLTWVEFAAARKKFEMFLDSLANRDLPIFPSLIILDDGNATDFDSDVLQSAYKATFEIMVSGKIAANVPGAAKRYAYALESMLRNIPRSSMLFGVTGITDARCSGIETSYDMLKNNEQKTVFYQLFQTEVIYDIWTSAN